MDTKALFVVLLVAGVIGGFAINGSVSNDNSTELDTNESSQKNGPVSVGSQAPDFLLTDPDGNDFNISDFEGEKVVVLEFMNLGCGTCKNFENDVLKNYYNDTRPEDVEVFSITQTKYVNETTLAERGENMGWKFIKGSSEMTDAYDANRSPTVVIIDKGGVITYLNSGSMSISDLEDKVNSAI